MLDWLSHSSIDEIKNLFAHVAVIYYLRIFPSSGIGLVGNLRIASKLFLKKMRKKQNREVRACGFLSLATIIKKCAKYEVWACGLSNIGVSVNKLLAPPGALYITINVTIAQCTKLAQTDNAPKKVCQVHI